MSGSFFSPIELEVMAKLASACGQLNESLDEHDSDLFIEWRIKDHEGEVACQAEETFTNRVFIYGKDD